MRWYKWKLQFWFWPVPGTLAYTGGRTDNSDTVDDEDGVWKHIGRGWFVLVQMAEGYI
jgi:hypothetical protein